MSDINTVKAQIQSLINLANTTTGNSDTNLTDGVNALVSGYGQGGGSLEGLENGYDVMFYKEDNEALAFYSIKQGEAINPPFYSCSNWIDQDGVAIVFPYTPTADISLWADNSTLSALLYDHFAISPEEYPYICIQIRNGTGTETTGIGFAKTMKMTTNASNVTSVSYSDVKAIYFSYNLWSYTIEEIVEYLMANYTSDSFTRNFVTYQSNATYYKFYVNHSLEGLSYTNWIQFE